MFFFSQINILPVNYTNNFSAIWKMEGRFLYFHLSFCSLTKYCHLTKCIQCTRTWTIAPFYNVIGKSNSSRSNIFSSKVSWKEKLIVSFVLLHPSPTSFIPTSWLFVYLVLLTPDFREYKLFLLRLLYDYYIAI